MATQVKETSPDVETAQKLRAMHIENQQNLSGLSTEDAAFLQNYPEEKKKRVIRKVDVSNCEHSCFSTEISVQFLTDILVKHVDQTHPHAFISLPDHVSRQDEHR